MFLRWPMLLFAARGNETRLSSVAEISPAAAGEAQDGYASVESGGHCFASPQLAWSLKSLFRVCQPIFQAALCLTPSTHFRFRSASSMSATRIPLMPVCF